jgi:8-oxo-dGTP pyrophosphatase MutT (NUDIX family)
LIIEPAGRVLLFRFVFKRGALAGEDYWATPGGGVEEGETFEQAAIRELREETGIRVESAGPQVGQREFVLQLSDGEHVVADERFFRVEAKEATLSRDEWTAEEAEVIVAHRWWSRDELLQTSEAVWPENLIEMPPKLGLCRSPFRPSATLPTVCLGMVSREII